MKAPKVAIALGTMLMLPAGLQPATLRGRVYLSGRLIPNALVSIEDVPDNTHRFPEKVYLRHTDQEFTPRVVPIVVGTTVEFHSQGMPCRLYSISEAAAFNLSRQPGPVKSFRFERPGVVEVRCADHPSTLGYIVIKKNLYFALTNEAGEYAIRGVTTGEYRTEVWHEGQVLTRKATAIHKGETVIDFHLEPAQPSLPANENGRGEPPARPYRPS